MPGVGVAAAPEISATYEEVRNDKLDTNWLYLSYEDGTDKLQVAGKGKGGLTEFVTKLKDDQAGFGYVRVTVGNDQLSQRAKFVLVSWCGPNVKVMRKAKLSVHIAEVKQTLPVFAVEIQTSTLADLKEDAVITKLKKAMGANYDRQNSEY
ncbi:hypothetical protein AMAG_08494 [Allomyces macrogynus ATCC 38327]|uniref:ADF-H domain-containing protein n=1 Tax=Allomyces macrogynus (strain ATCC 38327) TaxID=578462 RepID=A0A0L0SLG1_ALLM3|nr:hypothetical protein AMAG_08494 [Allomyces macrogynus ATCC 38327]|eukprot:KNE63357.1 hypothetical protein AMAG_08494 [Allomyces macrogynus ATCC 38327]